ncbi:MAG TPA: hypothetical protein VG873_13265 [Burkholderiales bacterium]|nr:hypothetical protein [Burkholderiales bacterium]
MSTLFRRAIDDSRLIPIEARDMFEWHTAEFLAAGWRPGNEVLLSVAIKHFDWENDRRRLLRFGWVGANLDRALQELNAFERDDDYDLARTLVRRLRSDAPPTNAQLADGLPVLDWFGARYPVLFPLITSAPNLERWHTWHHKVPAWRRKLGEARTKRFRRDEKKGSRLSVATVVLAFLALGALSRLLTGAGPSTVQPPSREFSQQARPAAPSPPATNISGLGTELMASAGSTPSTSKCTETARSLKGHGEGFGPDVDRLIVSCISKNLLPSGSASDPAIQAAVAREALRSPLRR